MGLLTKILVDKIAKEVVKDIAKPVVKKTAKTVAKTKIAKKVIDKAKYYNDIRNIIDKGINYIEENDIAAKDRLGTVRQELRLADVRKVIDISKKPDATANRQLSKYNKQQLSEMFNINRLKSHTYQYIDIHVDRIIAGNGSIIDKGFDTTIRLGTASESGITKVKRLGREINSILSGFNKVSEESKEQIYATINRNVDDLIKDIMDLSKGININKIKEKDAERLITTIKQLSEVAELPRNVDARNAVSEWNDEMKQTLKDASLPGLEGLPVEQVDFLTVKYELDRMYDRLEYDSDERRNTNVSFYDFKRNASETDGGQNVKNKFSNEIFKLARTNAKPSPNIRGSHRRPDAHGQIFPEYIDDFTYDMMQELRTLRDQKLKELKRG